MLPSGVLVLVPKHIIYRPWVGDVPAGADFRSATRRVNPVNSSQGRESFLERVSQALAIDHIIHTPHSLYAAMRSLVLMLVPCLGHSSHDTRVFHVMR